LRAYVAEIIERGLVTSITGSDSDVERNNKTVEPPRD
jgi:hypothetical protein